jgi:hypothetical protein
MTDMSLICGLAKMIPFRCMIVTSGLPLWVLIVGNFIIWAYDGVSLI